MENSKGWGKVKTHIHQMFGNPSRVPPLLDGATYPETFIIRIHPIMHNQVHPTIMSCTSHAHRQSGSHFIRLYQVYKGTLANEEHIT
jgi:hypothetical protein